MITEENIIQVSPEVNEQNLMKDAFYAMKICRRYMMLLGIWQLPIDTSAWRSILGNISVIICYYGIGIRGVPTGLYLIFIEKRPAEQLRLIIRFVWICMSLFKYVSLRFYQEKIVKCLKHIELDWCQLECSASRDIMLGYARFGHTVTKICASFTYVSAILLALLPIVAIRFRDQTYNINITNGAAMRSFAIPSYFVFSVFSETPLYEVICTSQVIGAFVLHSLTVTYYSLAVVIVMHACGQLNILMSKLNELVDGGGKVTNYHTVDERMSDIIRHHVRALKFINFAEKMLRGIFLVDLLGYTFEICCMGYFSLVEFRAETKNPIATGAWTTVLITFTFNVFSFCYIGELLTQECIKVGEVTYMVDWHRLPGKKSLELGLIITMAQTPVTLTAGGAIQLSMRCFAAVVRTAVGYLNMLRTMMD